MNSACRPESWAAVRRRARRRARARLRQREYWAANALHQLRNAVTTLSLQADLLARAEAPAERQEITRALQRRLLQLGHYLAQLERLERPNGASSSGSFNLAACAHEVVCELLPLAQAQGVDLGLAPGSLPPDPGVWAAGDASAVREALFNVVLNAVEHTPPGQPVRVSVGRNLTSQAWVKVADTGPGLGGASRNRLFMRFFRDNGLCNATFRSSHGIGLDIAYRLIQVSGGNIKVLLQEDGAVPGPGLTLVITLKLRDSPH